MSNRTDGSDLKNLGGNISLTLGRNVISLAMSVTTGIILARTLGPTGRGVFAIFSLLPTMLATLANLGVQAGSVYLIGRGEVNLRTALRGNILIWLPLAAGCLVPASLLLVFKGSSLFPGIAPGLLWLGLSAFPLLLLQAYLSGLLQAAQDFRRYNTAGLFQSASLLGAVILAVAVFDLGVRGAAFAYIASAALSVVITGRLLVPHIAPAQSRSGGMDVASFIRQCIAYGAKAHLSNAVTFINYRADLYLVNLLVHPGATGVYVIASALAERLWMLSSAVSTVVFPRLVQLHADEPARRDLTPLIGRFVLWATVVAAPLVAVIARPLVGLLYGNDFLEAVPVLQWLLPGIVALAFGRVLANDIAARGRPELNLYAGVLAAVVNIGLNLVLIPRMGMLGAALATSTAYLTLTSVVLLNYVRLSGNSWWAPILPRLQDFALVAGYIRFLISDKRHDPGS